MKIKHIEKTTLLDYPGKIACTIFFYGCSFRCGFCYNPSLVLKEETCDLNENEVLNFLEKRKKVLEGVCFTGGEPLMTITTDFLKKVKALGYKIKIDTNGSFPEKLKEIISLNLVDYIAMDIKSSKEKYSRTIGLDFPIEKIEESIKIISNFPEYEFRTTILESIHTKQEVENMFKWLKSLTNKKLQRFSLQGFKNTGDFVDNKFKQEKNTTEKHLKELELIAKNYAEIVNTKY